jgi:inner membrane protein
MDPVTQGLLGAAAAQALGTRRLGRRAWLYGAIGGMAADLDVFIRSSTDPLVAFEYHRHFTHALAFIPVGGLVAALPWLVLGTRWADARRVIEGTTIGYATHALLDACTAYGTLLWWPFSDARVAWSFVSIVDPLVTIPLAAAVVVAARWRSSRPAALGLLYVVAYIAVWGRWQRDRAMTTAAELADARGHVPARMDAFPTSASNVVWRTVYLHEGIVHVDRVRTPWLDGPTARVGAASPLVTEADLDPAVVADRDTLDGFRTFRWFALGWVTRHPDDPTVIGDARYSAEVASVVPLWGIRLHPGRNPPVTRWRWQGDFGASFARRWDAIWSDEPDADDDAP